MTRQELVERVAEVAGLLPEEVEDDLEATLRDIEGSGVVIYWTAIERLLN